MILAQLVRMANQIAAHVPDREDVANETAEHLHATWTPGMIAELASYAREHPQELDPAVLAALATLAP